MARSSGLVYSLVNAHLITSDKGREIEDNAVREGMPIVTYVVNNKIVSSEDLRKILEREYGYPYLDLDQIDVTEIGDKYLNEKLIVKNHALPVFVQNKTLYLAMSDPTNVQALDDFGFTYAMHTDTLLVDELKLQKAIGKLFSNALDELDVGLSEGELADLETEDPDANVANDPTE